MSFSDYESAFLPSSSANYADTLLATGGTSLIFKSRVGNKFYIRKRLKPSLACLPELADLPIREFEIGQQLHHKNIPRYIFLDQNVFPHEVIIEYIEGKHPLQYLSEPRFSLTKCFRFYKTYSQLRSVSSYLSKKSIKHADIKPDNLLLDENGQLFLLDFSHASSKQWSEILGGTPEFSLAVSEKEAIKATLLTLAKPCLIQFPLSLRFLTSLIPSSLKVHFKLYGPLYYLFSVVSIGILVLLLILSTCSTQYIEFKNPIDTHSVQNDTVFDISNSVKSDTVHSVRDDSQLVYKVEKSPQPVENKLKRSTDFNSTAKKENLDSNFLFGYALLNEIKSHLLKNPNETYRIARDRRTQLIIQNYKNWESMIAERGITTSHPEFTSIQSSYLKGYYQAMVESDSLLSKLKR